MNWLVGIFLLLLVVAFNFTGYLLPWDQLAYWALTVFLSGAEAAPAPPVVNQNVLLVLQGGPSLGANGLLMPPHGRCRPHPLRTPQIH